MQAGGEVVRTLGGNGVQVFLDTAELFQQHGFQQGGLAWEMCVDGLFAHAHFLGEVIHRDAVKTMSEEMLARGADDPLPCSAILWNSGGLQFPAGHDGFLLMRYLENYYSTISFQAIVHSGERIRHGQQHAEAY